MHQHSATDTSPAAGTRVLIVADWAVDARAVVAAASDRDRSGASELDLVVPAWLHGLDWAGDPRASGPCALRQVESIQALAGRAGLEFTGAAVGDPDPATAVLDALADWEADEVLLCVRPRKLRAGPFDLARRVHRATGLPVRRVAVPPASVTGHRRNGHCAFERPELARTLGARAPVTGSP